MDNDVMSGIKNTHNQDSLPALALVGLVNSASDMLRREQTCLTISPMIQNVPLHFAKLYYLVN